MIINIMCTSIPSFDDIRITFEDQTTAIIGKVVWCSGFYVNYQSDFFEINVFDEEVSASIIIDQIEHLISNSEGVRIRIQKGNICSQYAFRAREHICVN